MNALYYVFIIQHQCDLQLQGHGAQMQNLKEEQDFEGDTKNKKCSIPFGILHNSKKKKNMHYF